MKVDTTTTPIAVPTDTDVKFVQMAGRGLRVITNSDAMIPVEKIVHVMAESIEAKEAACEVAIMRAATGAHILSHVLIRLQNRYSFNTDGFKSIRDSQHIVAKAKDACNDAYYTAHKEYSEL